MAKAGALCQVTRDALQELYWGQRLSCPQIAERLGGGPGQVRRLMERYGIPRRTNSESQQKGSALWPEPSKGLLEEMYSLQGLTCVEMSQKLGMHPATVFKKLELHDIPRRAAGARRTGRIDAEVVARLYWGEGLSRGAIARRLGVCPGTVEYYMKRYGVPPRPQRLAASVTNKGKVGWAAGLTKETHPGLAKRARGLSHPYFGKTGPASRSFGRRHTEEWKRRMSELRRGRTLSEEAKLNMSRGAKGLWSDPNYKDRAVRLLRLAQRGRPTTGEAVLIALFQEHNLPYRYVGDGSVVIYGLNPDFINCNGDKKIIEFFGNYWHREMQDLPYERTEEGRREVFSHLGFSTLVIWEDELGDMEAVLTKVRAFTEG